jgi:hypothetical protein
VNPAIFKALDRFERLAGVYHTDRTDFAVKLHRFDKRVPIDWLRLLAVDNDTFLADMIGLQQQRDGWKPICALHPISGTT